MLLLLLFTAGQCHAIRDNNNLNLVSSDQAVPVISLCTAQPYILTLHRSRYPPFDPAPPYTGYFNVANLSAIMSRLIPRSTFQPLREDMIRRPNHGGSSHAQPFLVFFPAYSHAGGGEAYEDGEDGV